MSLVVLAPDPHIEARGFDLRRSVEGGVDLYTPEVDPVTVTVLLVSHLAISVYWVTPKGTRGLSQCQAYPYFSTCRILVQT